MRLDIEVAERDAKVGVDVGGAALPAWCTLLQAEHGARELETQLAERTQRHRRHRREHAPPQEPLWDNMLHLLIKEVFFC